MRIKYSSRAFEFIDTDGLGKDIGKSEIDRVYHRLNDRSGHTVLSCNIVDGTCRGQAFADVQVEFSGHAKRRVEPGNGFKESAAASLAEIALAVEGQHGPGAGKCDVAYRLGAAGVLDHTVIRATDRTDPFYWSRDSEEQLKAVVVGYDLVDLNLVW